MHQANGEPNGVEDKRHSSTLEQIVARDLMGEGIDYALASDDIDDLRYVLIMAKHAIADEKRRLELEKRFSQRIVERAAIENICMREAFESHREEVRTLRGNVVLFSWLQATLIGLLAITFYLNS